LFFNGELERRRGGEKTFKTMNSHQGTKSTKEKQNLFFGFKTLKTILTKIFLVPWSLGGEN